MFHFFISIVCILSELTQNLGRDFVRQSLGVDSLATQERTKKPIRLGIACTSPGTSIEIIISHMNV